MRTRNATVVSYLNLHRCGSDSSWSCRRSSSSNGSSSASPRATAVTLSSREVMNVSVMRGTYASSMLGVSPLRYGTLLISLDHSARR